jgi:hypothetical protein
LKVGRTLYLSDTPNLDKDNLPSSLVVNWDGGGEIKY